MNKTTLRASVPVLLLFSFLAACSYHMVKSEAFGAKKTYAVVSIQAFPKIQPQGQQQGSLTGLAKRAGKDSGLNTDSAEVLEQSVPLFIKALKSSGSFTLMPEETVLASKAYAGAQADDPKVAFTTYKTPKGYKFLSMKDSAKLGLLAKKLKVDGVIVLNVQYGYVFSGVNVAGLVSAGKQRGFVRLFVLTYDRSGALVWKDMVAKTSEASIGAIGETGNFKKLHPLILEAAASSAKELSDSLRNSIAKR